MKDPIDGELCEVIDDGGNQVYLEVYAGDGKTYGPYFPAFNLDDTYQPDNIRPLGIFFDVEKSREQGRFVLRESGK